MLLQRYTFWSNSQQYAPSALSWYVVYATTKIHILKQFTTPLPQQPRARWLFMLLQRYTFWSNSQQLGAIFPIHPVVYATTKIHILKQFTTNGRYSLADIKLFILLQRYTFWSNSQLSSHDNTPAESCLYYYKDTHFEAIHNKIAWAWSMRQVVYTTTKKHILKQFTTGFVHRFFAVCCLCYYKDTHFEAIHNFALYYCF